MTTNVLFVCSGNICRSPMALVIARHRASQMQLALEFDSAGTLMIEGAPADPKAVSVCKDISIDLTEHRSKGLNIDLVTWADHILVMEVRHSQFIESHFPDATHKTILMGHLAGQLEIPDPIGKWRRTFRLNRDMVQQAVDNFLRRFATE